MRKLIFPPQFLASKGQMYRQAVLLPGRVNLRCGEHIEVGTFAGGPATQPMRVEIVIISYMYDRDYHNIDREVLRECGFDSPADFKQYWESVDEVVTGPYTHVRFSCVPDSLMTVKDWAEQQKKAQGENITVH